ncbi:hypothetical protein [Haloglycomyces albus]|uniref:hypothetical protein n=1 Tax=Haloglycomyces albus TaxID=526067 RepID=UPI00046CAE40|nr:hypothetical protein [Haloglycomyces albus]
MRELTELSQYGGHTLFRLPNILAQTVGLGILLPSEDADKRHSPVTLPAFTALRHGPWIEVCDTTPFLEVIDVFESSPGRNTRDGVG